MTRVNLFHSNSSSLCSLTLLYGVIIPLPVEHEMLFFSLTSATITNRITSIKEQVVLDPVMGHVVVDQLVQPHNIGAHCIMHASCQFRD